jgi:hypothetical protein
MIKVLMVLPAYPPSSAIGGVRNSNFAKYLPEFGVEPIVVSEPWNNELFPVNAPNHIKTYRINKTYNSPLGSFIKKKTSTNRFKSYIKRIVKYWYKEIFVYPDDFISDKSSYLNLCKEIIINEKPDIIYSSAMPVTAHIVASELVNEYNLPWLADFRDLWTQRTYTKHIWLRKFLERRLEIKTMKNATAFLTVSKPLALKLEELHNKKSYVVTNGFEPQDYVSEVKPRKDVFNIVYTGQLYSGKRDPFLIFKALDELISENKVDKNRIELNFYGVHENEQPSISQFEELSEVVRFKDKIPYKESLKIQQEATILLQINSLDKGEKGVYTGKLFEYLGAKRPILAIPKIGGVVDELMLETNAGTVLNSKDEIKNWITDKYIEFISTGNVNYSGNSKVEKYTRKNKTQELSKLIHDINAN